MILETGRRNGVSLDQINESIVNGQSMQVADQIRQYGVKVFFAEYTEWLEENYPCSGCDTMDVLDKNSDARWENFTNAVNWYFRNWMIKKFHG